MAFAKQLVINEIDATAATPLQAVKLLALYLFSPDNKVHSLCLGLRWFCGRSGIFAGLGWGYELKCEFDRVDSSRSDLVSPIRTPYTGMGSDFCVKLVRGIWESGDLFRHS